MSDKMMTKEEMKKKLEKNSEKVKKSIGFDDIEDVELPPGPHFSPTNEVDLQRRKNEITGKKSFQKGKSHDAKKSKKPSKNT